MKNLKNDKIESQLLDRRSFIETSAKTVAMIVTATQFGGMTSLFASEKKVDKADVIYVNGNVYTVNAAQKKAEAFAIKDGKFLAVGTSKEMSVFKDSHTKIVDLKGKFVMPSLIDEHIHPDMGADNYLNVFLPSTDNWATIKQKLTGFAKNNPKKKWIHGSSIDWLLDDNGLIVKYGLPSNKSILDDIITDRPVALWDQGAHTMLLNSKALEELNITDKSPNPDGGIFVKDKNGKLTGVIRETACTLVLNALDNFSKEDWTKKGMIPFLDEMSSYGITGMCDAYAIERNASVFSKLDKGGKLNHWINLYMPTPLEYNDKKRSDNTLDFILNSKKYKTEQVYPAGIKFLLDGSAGGKTAVMLKPFRGEHTYSGKLRYPEDKLTESMQKFSQMGFAIKAHAIGDRSIRLALDVFKTLPKRTSGAMNSVAHGTFIDPADVSRFVSENVVYEASPAIWFPNTGVPIIKADIGEKRLAHAWPVNKLMTSGAVVSYGSDWPVSMTPNPWPGMESIITRQIPGGSKEALNPEFAIDLASALKIFTLNGAVAMGIDDKTGSIQTGKSADFIVLQNDLFEISKFDIHKTKVLSTVFRGSEVYSATDKRT